ncbi:putative calcium-binding protein CML16 [Acorus calamus]|uniref:Calcium-binding protein CML16 n=1 Tax=Acorus calamus TaxID=4465 RepID=A0AAV9D2H8_ACOCL|nr:putative calcium-binding protein CML16 [Acorus calamus]
MKFSLKPLVPFKSKTKSNKSSSSDVVARHDPNSASLGSQTSSISAATTPRTVLRASSECSVSAFCEISEIFRFFDLDGNGLITKEELVYTLGRIGRSPPSEKEVELMIAEADRDGDGCISFDEFGTIGPDLFFGGGGAADRAEELRGAFEVFDVDGDGKISAEELMRVFESISGGGSSGGGGCSIEECRRMIGGVDSDGDGLVCFEDFARMMERVF